MVTASESVRGADDLEALSALVDGELDDGDAGRACGRWRDDAPTREAWHAWQLIGDVMRSDDLASTPGHDSRFLTALRTRLADEPVVLAPPVVAGAPRRRQRSLWIASSAVAAGFVVVAGAVLMLREPAVSSTSAVAQAGAAAVKPASDARNLAEADPQALIADPKLIRDARLDRYLAAHKQFAGSSALGVPSGYLRAATTDASR